MRVSELLKVLWPGVKSNVGTAAEFSRRFLLRVAQFSVKSILIMFSVGSKIKHHCRVLNRKDT
jgi:hypothetical protein